MNIQETIIEAVKGTNPDIALNSEADYNNMLKDMGIDSIQFLNVIMTVCDKLSVDVGLVVTTELSTESSVNDFVENFKTLMPATATA